jgi:hypothetical protein
VAQKSPQQGGEGLSLQTLAIAALASGAAAVVTSYFWQKGTLISAAMTPVIVTVVSEMLKRPAQTVRRAAARTAAPARQRERVPLASGAGAGSPAERPSRELPAPREPVSGMSEMKVYRSGGGDGGGGGRRFGRVHWKIVGATAAAAFVIAIGALTLPELLFGSSVSGSHSTTFFGGSSKSSSKKDADKTKTTTTDEQKTATDDQKTVTEQTTETVPSDTAPAETAPDQQTPQSVAPKDQSTPPASTTPAPSQAPQQEQQQAPAQSTPTG